MDTTSRHPFTTDSPVPLQPSQPSIQPSGVPNFDPGVARMSERSVTSKFRSNPRAKLDMEHHLGELWLAVLFCFCRQKRRVKTFLSSLLATKVRQNGTHDTKASIYLQPSFFVGRGLEINCRIRQLSLRAFELSFGQTRRAFLLGSRRSYSAHLKSRLLTYLF